MIQGKIGTEDFDFGKTNITSVLLAKTTSYFLIITAFMPGRLAYRCNSRFVFGRYLVRILAVLSSTLTDVSRVILQPLGLSGRSSESSCCPPLLLVVSSSRVGGRLVLTATLHIFLSTFTKIPE
jgi:hypothetical protein